MDKKTKILAIALFIVILIPKISYSKKVLPEFTGEWFEQVTINTIDTCNEYQYSYKNKSSNKDEIIHKIREDLSRSRGCECKLEKVESGFNSDNIDLPDFPASPNDFLEIIKHNPTAPTSEYLTFSCSDAQGHSYSEGKYIYPSYHCPSGSRVLVGRNNLMDRHCSNPPTVCMADVVGRDLNVSRLRMLGHVGITTNFVNGTYGNYVLEVLSDDPKVINIHTLKNFEEVVPNKYWGEVYDLPEVNIGWIRANNIFNAGMQQQAFNPKYTFTDAWQEGRFERQATYNQGQNKFTHESKITQAIFRCDTFVYYTYLKGGIKIPILLMHPPSLFKAFLHRRIDVPSASSNRYYELKELTRFFNHKINYDNLMVLDKVMKGYLENPKYTRQDKINTLVTRIKTTKEYFPYSYLVDSLASLTPVEAIPDLIKEYNTQQDIKKKINLLSAIARSAIVKNPKKAGLDSIENIKTVQTWILQILQTETDSVLLHEAIFYSIHLLPMTKENYSFIVEAMNKLELSSALDGNKKNFYLLAMAFANDDMQKWLLPRLLAIFKSNTEKIAFDKQLYFFIKELPYGEIEGETKLKLVKYINSTIEADKNNVTFNQLNALAILTTDSVDSKNNKLLNHLLTTKYPQLQADLIVNLDETLLLQLSALERKNLESNFHKLLRKVNKDDEHHIYELALSKLLETNKP